jgi:hypothetical protein
MTDAPERIWHTIDRQGKISLSPDAHVEPCFEVSEAYFGYTRTDISQARIAELEAALARAVQIAENYATIYSEGKPDDWEDRADNMMWGIVRDIAVLKAKP